MTWPRPFERSVDREQLRRRILAFAGIWFLLAGMLAALGFGAVLLASLAFLLVGGVLAGGVLLLRRYGPGPVLRTVPLSLEPASRRVGAWLDRASGRVGAWLDQARTLLETRQQKRVAADRHREALRLNELGAQLRRDGEHERAVEQHRAALAIVRELGDRRAEALTLNNLALALVHTSGGVAVAVEHFEESLALLRELGDEEHEGQVIANLGFVRRRQGRDEDAASLLNEALDKLPPQSSAYRQVEEQLRRAS